MGGERNGNDSIFPSPCNVALIPTSPLLLLFFFFFASLHKPPSTIFQLVFISVSRSVSRVFAPIAYPQRSRCKETLKLYQQRSTPAFQIYIHIYLEREKKKKRKLLYNSRECGTARRGTNI